MEGVVSTIMWTVHLRLTTLAHTAEGFFHVWNEKKKNTSSVYKLLLSLTLLFIFDHLSYLKY
jgi:hypothetical protein